MRFLGIDLAWGEGSEAKPANDSGVVALDPSGEVVDAGWTSGLASTQAWIEKFAKADTLLFIDAPLIVDNPAGQRLCETDPPLDLASHQETRALIEQSSPQAEIAYKRREDLIDAVICAWTAAAWFRFGFERCQVLGLVAGHADPQATIIAPCRPEQRISPSWQL